MSWRNRAIQHRRGLWRLSSAVGVLTPDDSGYGNDGTMVNAPVFADTPWGVQCMEFDGDDAHVNLGDLTYLNAVSAFTIAFWMNQDVLDQVDYILRKEIDGNNHINILTSNDGAMYCRLNAAGARLGWFDYSTVISAGSWYHVAWVFDGTQTGDANRLVCYVNGIPVTLGFVGAIPAVTVDLVGQDALIGGAVQSFDGKLFDFQIHSAALSRDEVNALIRGHD